MSLCHTVQLDTNKVGKVSKSANSPDELALVDGAEDVGFYFNEKTPQYLGVTFKHSPKANKNERYETLVEFPFDSDRKRMSLVLRNAETKQLILMCKGADTVMIPRTILSTEDKDVIEDHLYKFACSGLRTLMMSQKTLDEAHFKNW